MTEIEALMARLKELDPKAWLRIRRGVKVPPWIVIGCWHTDMQWVIQGVIQEAIRARSGSVVLEPPVADGWGWGAEVRIGDYTRIRVGAAPIGALLAAYIAALEAQQGAGE